jgi:FdhE protein
MYVTPQHLQQRIQACRKAGVVPEPLLQVVEKVALWQLEHPVEPGLSWAITPTDAQRHRQGVPLVPRAVFPAPQDTSGIGEVLQLLEETALAPGIARMQEEIREGRLDLGAAAQAYVTGDEAFFAPWVALAPESPRLLPFVLASALTPWLEAVAQAARGEEDFTHPDFTWNHGHCPVCGALPVMGNLHGKEGHRIHTCSLCHTAYRVPRLQCPFCLEIAHGELGFLDAPELPGFRLYTCATCRMYIKVTDFRSMDRTSWPVMDDLESMALDLAAMQQGWRRATVSAWGF